ncbi:hypothetical protein RhiirA5_433768, partial [Rhizophagus irregularis]
SIQPTQQYRTPQSQNYHIQHTSYNPLLTYQKQTTSRPHDNNNNLNYENLLDKIKQLENQVHTLTDRITQLENKPKQYEMKFSNIENQVNNIETNKKHYTRSSTKSSSPRASADDSDNFPQTEDDTVMHHELTELTDNAVGDGIIEPDSDYTQNEETSGTSSFGYSIFSLRSHK